MVELKFVEYDADLNKDDFIQLNIGTSIYHWEGFMNSYKIDTLSILNTTHQKYAENSAKVYADIKSPEGMVYILYVDGVAGSMGAVRKLGETVGEIKRMYNHPDFRGKGLGTLMLSRLLEKGRELGCVRFILATPKFAHAAQHLYKKAGFIEKEDIPEADIGVFWRPYFMFMEKIV